MEKRVGTIETTLKEIQDHLALSKEELIENQMSIKEVQESFDSKIDTISDKLTDVFNVVTKLQNTIIFVLASGSLVGAVVISIGATVLGI